MQNTFDLTTLLGTTLDEAKKELNTHLPTHTVKIYETSAENSDNIMITCDYLMNTVRLYVNNVSNTVIYAKYN